MKQQSRATWSQAGQDGGPAPAPAPPTARRGPTGPGTGRRRGRSSRATETPEPLAKSPSLCEGKDTPTRDAATRRGEEGTLPPNRRGG